MHGYNRKLLVFTKYCWPEGGGANLSTHLVLNFLSKNFDIILVSGTHPSKTNFDFYIYKYIYLKKLEQNYKPLDFLGMVFLSQALRNAIEEADIIYVYTPLPFAIIAKKICPNKKVIVHLHNYQPLTYSSVIFSNERKHTCDIERSVRMELLEYKSFSRSLLAGLLSPSNVVNRLALSYADAIICVSKRQAEIMISNYKEISGKVRVIYNPLPSCGENNRNPSEKPTLLYLGGDSYIKGFRTVLTAVSRLKFYSNVNNLKIICAGKFSDPIPISPLLDVIGKVKHTVIPGLYNSTWGLLAPSITEEPLSYAVVEAMANGVIPIASRVGGNPEIVQGTYAERMLFAPFDINDFIVKIEEILSLSKEDLIEIGTELRRATAKKFNSESIELSLRQLFID